MGQCASRPRALRSASDHTAPAHDTRTTITAEPVSKADAALQDPEHDAVEGGTAFVSICPGPVRSDEPALCVQGSTLSLATEPLTSVYACMRVARLSSQCLQFLGIHTHAEYLQILLSASTNTATNAAGAPSLTPLGVALVTVAHAIQAGSTFCMDAMQLISHTPWGQQHDGLRLTLSVTNLGGRTVLCISHAALSIKAVRCVSLMLSEDDALSSSEAETSPCAPSRSSASPHRTQPKCASRQSSVFAMQPVQSSSHIFSVSQSSPALASRAVLTSCEAPWMVTLLSLETGEVLAQNPSAAEYYGSLFSDNLPSLIRQELCLNKPWAGQVISPVSVHPVVVKFLNLLLAGESVNGTTAQPSDTVLSEVQQGRPWSQTIKVPGSFLGLSCSEEDTGDQASVLGGQQAQPAVNRLLLKNTSTCSLSAQPTSFSIAPSASIHAHSSVLPARISKATSSCNGDASHLAGAAWRQGSLTTALLQTLMGANTGAEDPGLPRLMSTGGFSAGVSTEMPASMLSAAMAAWQVANASRQTPTGRDSDPAGSSAQFCATNNIIAQQLRPQSCFGAPQIAWTSNSGARAVQRSATAGVITEVPPPSLLAGPVARHPCSSAGEITAAGIPYYPGFDGTALRSGQSFVTDATKHAWDRNSSSSSRLSAACGHREASWRSASIQSRHLSNVEDAPTGAHQPDPGSRLSVPRIRSPGPRGLPSRVDQLLTLRMMLRGSSDPNLEPSRSHSQQLPRLTRLPPSIDTSSLATWRTSLSGFPHPATATPAQTQAAAALLQSMQRAGNAGQPAAYPRRSDSSWLLSQAALLPAAPQCRHHRASADMNPTPCFTFPEEPSAAGLSNMTVSAPAPAPLAQPRDHVAQYQPPYQPPGQRSVPASFDTVAQPSAVPLLGTASVTASPLSSTLHTEAASNTLQTPRHPTPSASLPANRRKRASVVWADLLTDDGPMAAQQCLSPASDGPADAQPNPGRPGGSLLNRMSVAEADRDSAGRHLAHLAHLMDGSWGWHEVFIKRVTDPETNKPALLVVQHNVSERAEVEAQLGELSEAQLSLLSQIFPRHVIEQLGVDGGLTVANLAQAARSHPCATLLFLDLVGFTRMSETLTPEDVITFLNHLFSTFDLLIEKHGVQKIDTLGDAMMIGAGVLLPDADGFNVVDHQRSPEDNAARVFACAKDIIDVSSQMVLPRTDERVQVRVGIHSGPCVSGLIGLRLPKWTVLGDTVNVAARMEQTCPPGKVQVSAATCTLLGTMDGFIPTGGVHCKGKGIMETYVWEPPAEWLEEATQPGALIASPAADSTECNHRAPAALSPPGAIVQPGHGSGPLLPRGVVHSFGAGIQRQHDADLAQLAAVQQECDDEQCGAALEDARDVGSTSSVSPRRSLLVQCVSTVRDMHSSSGVAMVHGGPKSASRMSIDLNSPRGPPDALDCTSPTAAPSAMPVPLVTMLAQARRLKSLARPRRGSNSQVYVSDRVISIDNTSSSAWQSFTWQGRSRPSGLPAE